MCQLFDLQYGLKTPAFVHPFKNNRLMAVLVPLFSKKMNFGTPISKSAIWSPYFGKF
jgi:hypothetical protein